MMQFKSGDFVRVRSKQEILQTLDVNGQNGGLPFMPQMFDFCGTTFRIFKHAHKTCDTVNQTGGRAIKDCVHLDLRCDGRAYGGCDAGCLIFWRTAWLELVESSGGEPLVNSPADITGVRTVDEEVVWNSIMIPDDGNPAGPTYVCQATQLPRYSTALPWWDFRQYFLDILYGNVTLNQFMSGFGFGSIMCLLRLRIGWGKPIRWLYDVVQMARGGVLFPKRAGKIPLGETTPTCEPLNLQPGDLVRVKSYEEILATLNTNNENRGLYFDAEHVPYCGGIYRVKQRQQRLIDEKSGKMINLKSVSVLLDDVVCQARYATCRMLCPRAIYLWWREIWLERVS